VSDYYVPEEVGIWRYQEPLPQPLPPKWFIPLESPTLPALPDPAIEAFQELLAVREAPSALVGRPVWYEKGSSAAIEYYSAYSMEYALSLDNVFVIMLIMRYFSVPSRYHHRVLFWGVLGAIVMRGIFIFAGVLLVKRFHFVLYLFGAFLIFAGIKSLFSREEGPGDLSQNWLLRFLTRRFRFTTEMPGGRFVVRIEGKRYLTPLMLALILVEFTDLRSKGVIGL